MTVNGTEYSFRGDVRVVVHDPDTVELRTGVWNTTSTFVGDDERRGVLAAIVLGLYRGEPAQALTRGDGVTQEDVASVVETLLADGVLLPGAPRASGPAWAAAQTLGAARARHQAPERVVVLAPPELGELFARVHSAPDRAKVEAASAGVLEPLLRRDLFLEADGMAAAAAAEPFEEWAGAAVVLLWPELHPVLLENLNRLAHQVGFTFLPAVADGPFSILGPTVVPGLTPCFACAETRVVDALRDHTLYTRYRQAVAEGRVHGSAPPPLDPFQAVLASLAAWESASLLAHGTSFTAGKLLTLYAPTMEIMFHELVRVPGCPVCGTRPGLDAPLYADLQGYLKAHLGAREDR